jgi:hypothetical protein
MANHQPLNRQSARDRLSLSDDAEIKSPPDLQAKDLAPVESRVGS